MNPSQTERLLSYLKNTPLLEGYCISIYPSDKISMPDKINRHLCGSQGIAHLCHKICLPAMHEQIEAAISCRLPVFFRCPLGLFSFAVPLPDEQCLVCSGMRENLFDLYFFGSEQFESLKEKQSIHPYEILEQLEKLPVSTEKKVKETMSKVDRLIATYFSGEMTNKVDSSTNLDKILMDVSTEIEASDNFRKASSIFGESLGIILDSPLILIATRDEESNCCLIDTCWGTFRGSSYLHSKKLPVHTATLADDEVKELFPEAEMSKVLCIPLAEKEDMLGMVFIFEVCLAPQDASLIEGLAGKLSDKMKQTIRNREANLHKRDVRLLEMIRTLALTESQDDLMRLIMEMTAELVQASNGSLMMKDKAGKNLRITAALGMNQVIAKNFSTKIGEGIAGKVAASGIPLLVKDIEKDLNLGRRNRVRFGTKSCISLPLRLKGNIIGVLNLADKKNNAPFTRADQDILTTFVEQAIVILERTNTLKKAILNTITDPLTGLYNLRFIRKRLNEELSRSIRYNLQLSMIILSLSPNTSGEASQDRSVAGAVMKETARVLSSSLRDIDLVGRFGEVEFCVILPSTPTKEAMLVAERIQRNVRKELSNLKEIQLMFNTSIGIASFPDDGASPGDIINAARTAHSRAESETGNRIYAMQNAV